MEKYSIQFKTISNLRNKQLELLNVNEIINVINVNGGSWRKVTPKGSGSLPTPHSGYAATVIPWDIVLCNVVEYKWNTDTCDLYLH